MYGISNGSKVKGGKMDNQPITRRNRGIVRRRTTATSRRTSLLVFACTIPFASIVLIWQHAKLMDRLDGGGEYAAEFYDTDKKKEVTYWGDSMQQAVDVVKFVAYGSGELINVCCLYESHIIYNLVIWFNFCVCRRCFFASISYLLKLCLSSNSFRSNVRK